MTTFTIAVVVIVLLTLACFVLAGITSNEVFGIAGVIGALVSICMLVIFGIQSWEWKASKVKAELINAEYGTEYTQEQIFYASDVINTIREIKRTRIEINGNLMRQDSTKAEK